ncbi:MAG: TolC family protein [Candidatus Acidiferrales bacterium]
MKSADAMLKIRGYRKPAAMVRAIENAADSARLAAILLLFLANFAVLGGVANAQDSISPPAATLHLTLHGAVDLALRQNPQVQISSLNLAESIQNKNIARADLLPQAKLEVSDTAIRGNLEAEFGRPFPGLPQHIGPYQVFEAGPQFSMSVLDLSLWRRWQAAGEDVHASDADRESVREQMTLLVVSQYLGCLRAAADVRAAQSRADLAKALYDQANDLQQHGAGTGIDTLRSNVELQNETQVLLVAQTTERTSLYGLAQLLNVDPNQTIELDDALSFFETPDANIEQSLQAAYAARPEMRALEAQERAAADRKRATSESRWPSMHIVGNWDYEGLSSATGIPTYTYAAVIDVPIVTGGRIHAENILGDLELKKIAQQRQDLENQIAVDVKTAAAELASARSEVDVANQGVSLAQQEVQQARDRFSAGVANNIEVIQAQDALARANDNQIAALYTYNQARADLARATGQMESLYAK